MCYVSAIAVIWPLASLLLIELRKQMRLCMVTRPKYLYDLDEWIHHDLEPLIVAIEAEDFVRFEHAFRDSVDAANEFHRRWQKEFIVWRLPDAPPPDLDLARRD